MTLIERWRWMLGLLSRRSHLTAAGKPKQKFDTRAAAQKAADSMSRKSGREFDTYRCLWCWHFHFGGSVRTARSSVERATAP